MNKRFHLRNVPRALAVVVVAGLLVGSGPAALADTPQEGFWYFDVFDVQVAHDAGVTGAGVTIAVLDSQINLEVPTLKGADIEVQPSGCFEESGVLIPPTSTSLGAYHGTNVASLIVGTGAGYAGQTGVKGVAPGAKVLYFSVGAGNDDGAIAGCRSEGGKEYVGGLEAIYVNSAVAQGAQIISVSLGVDAPLDLVEAVANAEHKGVVIVGGLSNDLGISAGGDIAGSWPAAANGAVAVQRIDTNGVVPLNGRSNYDDRAVVAAPGVALLLQGSRDTGSWETQELGGGTSFATPIVSSFLALVKQKYPKATGNQLIQTLIHNTGLEDHELARDPDGATGYGIAVLSHLLRVDPTQYPDVNPLIKPGNWQPTAEMIANPPGVATPSPSATLPVSDAMSLSWLVPVVIGGVIFLLLAIGLIILVVVLATRRAKRPPTAGTGF